MNLCFHKYAVYNHFCRKDFDLRQHFHSYTHVHTKVECAHLMQKFFFYFPSLYIPDLYPNSLRLLKRYQCSGKEKQTLISVCFCVNDKFSCVSSSFPTLHFFHLSLNGECWDRNIHEYSADIPVQAPEALRHGVEIDFTVARESRSVS